MNNLILIGDKERVSIYINEYIKENKFYPHEVEYFNDTIKIEDARNLKKTLGFKVKTKKIYIFNDAITIEAQNSLLKNIEEADENTYFIFASNNEESLLATVRSRCLTIVVGSAIPAHIPLQELVRTVCTNRGGWENIDKISNLMEDHPFEDLLYALRPLLLENLGNFDSHYYYSYCKKVLPLLPLVQKNNVNRRIAVESIFI